MVKEIFDSIPEVLDEIREGRMVIVVDDGDRENEGDLVMAASFATPESIAFMAQYGRGIICVPMEGEPLDRLGLHPMIHQTEDPLKTAWTVSVDARQGTTTGVSAHDRAHTVQVLINPHSQPTDLARPGHIFPLRAKQGGVLRRAGHTEAGVDLARMAGLYPAGVICEIMKDDGTMARRDDLFRFARRHRLKICTIESLIEYRRRFEKLVERLVEKELNTPFGPFTFILYRTSVDDRQHMALVKGALDADAPVLVRMHTESLVRDVFGAEVLGEPDSLRRAMAIIEREGRGAIVYIGGDRQGSELMEAEDTEAAYGTAAQKGLREYGLGAQILKDLGLRRLRLLTDHPRRIVGLEGYDLHVEDCVPLHGAVKAAGRRNSASGA